MIPTGYSPFASHLAMMRDGQPNEIGTKNGRDGGIVQLLYNANLVGQVVDKACSTVMTRPISCLLGISMAGVCHTS
jgi:hypothetical protein